VNPGSDEIKFLSRAPITVLYLDRDQVLPKIARRRINKETLTAGVLDRDGREGSGRRVVARVRFGCGGWLKNAAGSGHRY